MSITKKGPLWEYKNSLWILIHFIIMFSGIGMFYAGKKVKVKKWTNYALIYIVVTWISFFIVGANQANKLSDVFAGIFLGSYIACIVHSFIIRKEYLIRLEMIQMQGMDDTDMDELRTKIANEYGINNNSKISSASFSKNQNKN